MAGRYLQSAGIEQNFEPSFTEKEILGPEAQNQINFNQSEQFIQVNDSALPICIDPQNQGVTQNDQLQIASLKEIINIQDEFIKTKSTNKDSSQLLNRWRT